MTQTEKHTYRHFALGNACEIHVNTELIEFMTAICFLVLDIITSTT